LRREFQKISGFEQNSEETRRWECCPGEKPTAASEGLKIYRLQAFATRSDVSVPLAVAMDERKEE
jgi:hypothetical protein